MLRVIVLMPLAIGIAGCHSSAGSASSGTWGTGKADEVAGIDAGSLSVAKYTVNGNELRFVVWSDYAGGSGIHGSSDDSGWMVEGTVGCHSDQEHDQEHPAPFKCRSSDGVSATMNIAGEDYDLSDGSLFLVSTREEKPKVAQIQVDINAIPADLKLISEFARSRKQIAEFFGQGAEATGHSTTRP